MNAGEIAGLVTGLLVFGVFAFTMFGGMQFVYAVYAERQYNKSLQAWYRRTNPNDPPPRMPVFSSEGDAD